jgi:hypothetical protein
MGTRWGWGMGAGFEWLTLLMHSRSARLNKTGPARWNETSSDPRGDLLRASREANRPKCGQKQRAIEIVPVAIANRKRPPPYSKRGPFHPPTPLVPDLQESIVWLIP